MAHFAKVLDGVVRQVIVAEPEFFLTFRDTSPGSWLQTSYNTRGGVHYGPDGQPDGGTALRANYAGVGDIYNQAEDVFHAPQWLWQPPVPMPQDGKPYEWNEAQLNWVELI